MLGEGIRSEMFAWEDLRFGSVHCYLCCRRPSSSLGINALLGLGLRFIVDTPSIHGGTNFGSGSYVGVRKT